jgi:molybdopterin-guanine dinucleotide biosynthesis protein MobB
VKVAAITGPSGAGKSTLIAALIRRYVAAGIAVGAIKHTHHPLNEEHRGDTGRFRDAGAHPVILAGDGEAIVFRDIGTSRVRFQSPDELLVHCDACEIVLVEGFKELGAWPRIQLDAQARPTIDELAANLDRIWRST